MCCLLIAFFLTLFFNFCWLIEASLVIKKSRLKLLDPYLLFGFFFSPNSMKKKSCKSLKLNFNNKTYFNHLKNSKLNQNLNFIELQSIFFKRHYMWKPPLLSSFLNIKSIDTNIKVISGRELALFLKILMTFSLFT